MCDTLQYIEKTVVIGGKKYRTRRLKLISRRESLATWVRDNKTAGMVYDYLIDHEVPILMRTQCPKSFRWTFFLPGESPKEGYQRSSRDIVYWQAMNLRSRLLSTQSA